jgi:hypothetical protein
MSHFFSGLFKMPQVPEPFFRLYPMNEDIIFFSVAHLLDYLGKDHKDKDFFNAVCFSSLDSILEVCFSFD